MPCNPLHLFGSVKDHWTRTLSTATEGCVYMLVVLATSLWCSVELYLFLAYSDALQHSIGKKQIKNIQSSRLTLFLLFLLFFCFFCFSCSFVSFGQVRVQRILSRAAKVPSVGSPVERGWDQRYVTVMFLHTASQL